MDRRSFLKTSALGGSAAAATTLAAPAYAQGKRTLTMVTSWPRGFAVLDDAASYLEQFVGEMVGRSIDHRQESSGRAGWRIRSFRRRVVGSSGHVPLG